MKLTCCTVIEVCNLIAKTYLHFHDGQCGGCLAIFSFSLVAPLWHERKINVCNMNTQITGAELSCLCACICERIFQCTRGSASQITISCITIQTAGRSDKVASFESVPALQRLDSYWRCHLRSLIYCICLCVPRSLSTLVVAVL